MNNKVKELVEWAKLNRNPFDCSVCDTEPEGCPGCGTSAYEAGYEAGQDKLLSHPDLALIDRERAKSDFEWGVSPIKGYLPVIPLVEAIKELP